MTRLDPKTIAEYGKAYSQKLCNDFFSHKDTISGAEIMNLSTIDQVNMFSLKTLYESWKSTTENFKSPYFDFENEKVKAALRDFMNVTSQHISVKKADFEPILAKASTETIALALNPNEYYDGVFREMPEFKCTKADLHVLQKYARINVAVLQNITEKFGEEESVFTNQALNWLEESSQNEQLDDEYITISQFNEVLPCDINQFYKGKKAETIADPDAETNSFFDNLPANPSKEPIKFIASPLPIEVEKFEIKATEKPILKQEEAASTFNEQFQTAEPNLNDTLKGDEKAQNIADLHQNSPIKNLSESISLNQKFIFINKLFNGDSTAYNDTLHILENCQNSDEAVKLLMYKYAPKYNWNLNSDEADELIDIVKRKAK